ncbi:DRC4 / nexin-dynein regulatory complex protein [Leishmania donovani]|uniref:Growth-arrest specific micro-tubule binding family protein n=1 Tax=Leishmania donovani TaxID=5661 RepID=A0A3S5H7Z1_LEIDO|nr:trypanin-like protein [Leishmania donovani]AYU82979.1 trypanin-like protein [Leishmania donovani]TPP44448.1 Growth-arrest specific micro-tubule binding family protein [Leishmania donovani]TPP46371.1 Growth-arrest specific micro-tubule binding family protein [Leishmania donovani]CAJ1992989.1 DRC4 / nexin-dynein regulatory complex protein [Leishmania donovani]CBZ38084.1 trypanin-like protein [Leishmania donovani]
MPPKRKLATRSGGAAASASPVAAPHVDGKDIWLATDALQKTNAMRNYFQLERDRIIAFWNISKRELEGIKESIREKEQEKAEQAERHEVEKQIFKQKIRHLLYENQVQLSTMKEEAQRALTSREEECRTKERNAARNLRDTKLADRELEVRHLEQQRALLTQQDKEIAEQQSNFEREIKEMHLRYEDLLKSVREEMDEARKEELGRIEERKEKHIAELRETHERTFNEIRDYFSEITSNNLETIRTLKDEVYARKRTETHNERAMYEVAQRNKRLTEPLAKLENQKKVLGLELENYLADKEALAEVKRSVKDTQQEIQTVSWEHEVLSQRYAKLVEDRDIILKKYNAMLQDIQRKSAFRRVLIQKKLELVQTQLEGRDAKLTELLKRANVNPDELKELEQKVHDLISEKDKTIEDLKQLLSRLTTQSERVVATYESYMENNGVSGWVGTSGAASGAASIRA